jgi:hypothetical protein
MPVPYIAWFACISACLCSGNRLVEDLMNYRYAGVKSRKIFNLTWFTAGPMLIIVCILVSHC